jgi:hypothetical protein
MKKKTISYEKLVQWIQKEEKYLQRMQGMNKEQEIAYTERRRELSFLRDALACGHLE